MKKAFLMIGLLLLTSLGLQAEETTDYITLTAMDMEEWDIRDAVNPGEEEVYIIVSLVGATNLYSGYNMDIHLPEGMEVVCEDGSPMIDMMEFDIYPYTKKFNKKTYTHQLSGSYGIVGERTLRVACLSLQNDVFTNVSGNLFIMAVKISPYAKPGIADITIDGVALKVAGGAEYDPAPRTDQNITIGTAATAPISVSTVNQWSTGIFPFDATLPEGVKAYSCSSVKDENYLALTEEKAIAAYTPYILYAENGYYGSLTGTVVAEKYAETCNAGFLTGAIVPQEITSGYVLQNLSDGAKFYRINDNDVFTIPAGKCWLSMPAKSAAYGFWNTTNVSTLHENMTDAPVYDLSGRQVSEMKAGEIYIVNGQTVLKMK